MVVEAGLEAGVEAGVGVPVGLELEKVSMTQRLTELSVYVFRWLCKIHNQQSLAVVSLVYGGTNDVACCRVFEQYFRFVLKNIANCPLMKLH